jgi:hypothetical protein
MMSVADVPDVHLFDTRRRPSLSVNSTPWKDPTKRSPMAAASIVPLVPIFTGWFWRMFAP